MIPAKNIIKLAEIAKENNATTTEAVRKLFFTNPEYQKLIIETMHIIYGGMA